jgi:hypothetical protein
MFPRLPALFAWLIAGSLLFATVSARSAGAAEKFAGTGRIDFFGYTDCVLLENATTRVVLCHQAGGRVLEYSLHGKNSMWLDPAQQGWVFKTGGATINPCGGRLDIGPELIIPPRSQLWLGVWTAEITGPRSARLTSEKDSSTGVQLIREFKLDAEGSRLWCTQIIRNVSTRTTSWCHWSRTLALGGGIGIVPLTTPSKFPQGYVRYDPGTLINPRPRDPNIRTRDGFLEIVAAPQHPKLGMDSHAGWFAYLMRNDVLFVKRFPTYPDRVYNEVAGLTISIWYDRDVRTELEPIGPQETLAPGATSSFTEEWELVPFPFPKSGEPVDLARVTTVSAPKHGSR